MAAASSTHRNVPPLSPHLTPAAPRSTAATPELCGVGERDFLVLVTAKPRPAGLMTTAAALPLSYSHSGYYESGFDEAQLDDELEGEDEGETLEQLAAGARGGGTAAGLLRRVELRVACASDEEADDDEAMARLAELGYGPVFPSTLPFFLSIDQSINLASLCVCVCVCVYGAASRAGL